MIIIVRRFYDTVERERRHMLAEMSQVRGLMPLLMKPRNKMQWTREDKQELKQHLRRLTRMQLELPPATNSSPSASRASNFEDTAAKERLEGRAKVQREC